jgi:hypothetical protein
MLTYAAHKRFGPSRGDDWVQYIEWSGLSHIRELVSTDTMLCPTVIDHLIDEDWKHNVHADNRVFRFTDPLYLKHRIDYDPLQHNILGIVEQPSRCESVDGNFEICGYDILDSYESISVLTNCGGFPDIFAPSEINDFGLLPDLEIANGIAARIRSTHPEDSHCEDCRVWMISRYTNSK